MIRVAKWKELFTRTEVEEIVVDILTEIKTEIEETDSGCGWDGYIKKDVINDYLQQEINALKENTDVR